MSSLTSPSKGSLNCPGASEPISSPSNGVTAVVVTNPLASSSFSSSTSRYQSSVMNKYKNLATPDLSHPLSTLKQLNQALANTTDPQAKYVGQTKDPFH